MANSWLRLWHDMPNDPKWRTIARISGQPISLVQAVFLHLLVSASQSVTRGHADVTNEDLASHFDVTESDIEAVINAMQGRVLDGNYLTGWSKRQVKKEDSGDPQSGALSAAERKRRQRQREKSQQDNSSCHAESRNVTTDKDKDKDKDLNTNPLLNPPRGKRVKNNFDPLEVELPDWLTSELWREWVEFRQALRKPIRTPQGAAGSLRELGKFREQGISPEAVIRHSIANEYQGLFAPGGNGGSGNQRNINQISPPEATIPDGFRGTP